MILINLFSCFDPSRYATLSLNWIALIMPLLTLRFMFWSYNSKAALTNHAWETLSKEIKILINNNSAGKPLIFIRLIMFILPMNVLGLYPYIFTCSSHLVLTLTLAAPLWLASIIYGVNKSLRNTIGHLIPSGTTWVLIPFIALAELISVIIRPITLAIRLATNIIAGHLLLSLLKGQGYSRFNELIKIGVLLSQILLLLLETGVALVQSYVFSTLSLLYLTESN